MAANDGDVGARVSREDDEGDREKMDLGGRAPRSSEASGKKIFKGSVALVEALSSHGMASEVVRRGRDPVWARS